MSVCHRAYQHMRPCPWRTRTTKSQPCASQALGTIILPSPHTHTNTHTPFHVLNASTWYHHTAKATHTHEHAHTTLSRTQRKHMDTHAPAHLQLEPPGLFLCLPLPHPAALRCLNLRCLRVSLRRCTQPGSDACNACGGPCQSLN